MSHKSTKMILILLVLLSMVISGCSDFSIPAPERMENATFAPTLSNASYIAIPIQADLSETVSGIKNGFDNPVASKSELVNIPTKLHIEHFVLATVQKEIEKLESKTVNETRRECDRSERRCARTERRVEKICRDVPWPLDIVCDVVEKTVCVAYETTCVAWKTVVIGTKVIQVPVKVVVDVQEEVLKVVDKVVDLDAEVDYTAIIADADVNLYGDNLSVSVDIDYKIKINSKLHTLGGKIKVVEVNGISSCGYDEPLKRLRFNLNGKLETKDGPGFTVSDTSWSIDWINECQLTAFDIQLSDILDLPIIEKAVKKAVNKAVDKLPKSIDLSSKVQLALNDLNKPHSLDKDLWLVPQINNIEISPVTGKDKNLSTILFVEARPAVMWSDVDVSSSAPIPEVKVGIRKPKLEINLGSKISFSKAKSILSENLNKIDDLPISIKDIEIYGSKEKLVFAIEISSPAKGTIYLVGTPKYEPTTNSIVVPDIDFTAETKNILGNIVDAIAHKHIVEALKNETVFPLDRYSEKALNKLTHKVIPIKGVGEVIIKANDICLTETWVTPDGIFASIILQGNSEANITK